MATQTVSFVLADPHRSLAGVWLRQEVERPRRGPAFGWEEHTREWRLTFRRPPADRLEYLFEIESAEGAVEVVCDPGNDRRAPGPFGDKSVVEWPDYSPPTWPGDQPRKPGTAAEVEVGSAILGSRIPVRVWTPSERAPDEPLPLLVTHDGYDFDHYCLLTRLLALRIEECALPPLRVALLAPVDRNNTYSASAAYANALAGEILPSLAALAPAPGERRFRAGLGASLGALAMLHAHRTFTASFGGLFLQSGSFFRRRTDPQEAGFSRFRRVSRFMGRVLTASEWFHPIPVMMTCGAAEENLANNRALARALAFQGYDVELVENRDAHNWVGWRDCLNPHLIDFLARMWG